MHNDLETRARALLPCPFCGNDGNGPIENALHISHTQNDWHPAYDCYSVQCDKCSATMGYSDSEEAAVAAWNTRAALTPPAVPADIAGLVDAADWLGENGFSEAASALTRHIRAALAPVLVDGGERG